MKSTPRAGEPKYVFDSKATQSRSEINARVNQHVNSTPDHVLRMQRIVGAPRSLAFTKHRFHSTKTFANLCGDDVRELQRRVSFFLENQEWYRSKGIPYQLGIMLSGPCGTGKSSAIRAIANATHRSIVNVNLSSIATASQLKRLFLNDALQVYETDEQAEPTPMLLPVSDRIFVLDEIDALGGAMVLDRSTGGGGGGGAAMPDELSLGELLTM
jgi:ATP-dependent 26S proteasome regulatory subunit